MKTLDLEQLKSYEELQMEGRSDIVMEIIENFHNVVPKQMQKMQALLANNKIAELSNEAHSLKSSCASVGALQMRAICEQIEALGKKSNAATTQEWMLLDTLKGEFELVKVALAGVRTVKV